MKVSVRRATLMSTAATLLMMGIGGGVGHAQTAADTGSATTLGEVVVTATKQTNTLNKVPLSVVAVSQKEIDREGIKSMADIARETPALTYQVPPSGDPTPSIAIRGISSTIGAQTTGVYLDDTALQKRNAIGLSASGTPIPTLFDLDRVEVLRGPQGTLYGGSSEGGAVRFITPQPSLTTYSVYAKAEGAETEDGGPSYGGGIAVGGPIVADKLGFRISGYSNHTGGWIDHVNINTGEVEAKDTNYRDEQSVRAALTWAPTADLKITPAFFASSLKIGDTDLFWGNIAQGTVQGSPGGPFPTYTYGPYNTLGDYRIGAGCNVGIKYGSSVQPCVITQPREYRLLTPSLTVEDHFGGVDVKSITSFIQDEVKGNLNYSYNEQFALGGAPFLYNIPSYEAIPFPKNNRSGISEELRASSAPSDSPLSWVAGVYYSGDKNVSSYYLPENYNDFEEALAGQPGQTQAGNIVYHRYQVLHEQEVAGFGEVNYKLTSNLKLIAGVRVSGTNFSYYQNTAGTLAGFTVPTVANGGLTSGSLHETPVTPKFGLEYQLNDKDMLYFTAAEGYRVGGVNQPPPAVRCASDLANLGVTSTPPTYASDHLWSYELGAKLRTPDNRGELNTSVYHVDWSNIQTAFELPNCGFGYNVNAGGAVSQGFDLAAQYVVIPGLRLSAQAAYTDAYYTSQVLIPSTTYALVDKGDRLPAPPWTVNLGVNYDMPAYGKFRPYVRATYQYSSPYQNSSGPNTANYAPDVYMNPETRYTTARLGVQFDGIDLSVFANNLFDSKDILSQTGGRNSCDNASCTEYDAYNPIYQRSTFQPRTVGMTATYRY